MRIRCCPVALHSDLVVDLVVVDFVVDFFVVLVVEFVVVAPVFSLLAGTRLSEDEDPYCRASFPLRFISGWR